MTIPVVPALTRLERRDHATPYLQRMLGEFFGADVTVVAAENRRSPGKRIVRYECLRHHRGRALRALDQQVIGCRVQCGSDADHSVPLRVSDQ
jgi:hypothetical protein